MKPTALFRLLLLSAATAVITVVALVDRRIDGPSRGDESLIASEGSDLDVEAELRDGCDRLIDLARGDSPAAPWAVAELQRAASAPWATTALRDQARRGLELVAEQRLALARR